MRVVQRGQVWLADFDPSRGREQRGVRPALVVSSDLFNRGRSGLVIAAPFTTTRRPGITLHIEVRPPDGGLREISFVMCEQMRAISVDRLAQQPFGKVSGAVLREVDDRIRLLFDIY
jgi:mRNA interferase MazF